MVVYFLKEPLSISDICWDIHGWILMLDIYFKIIRWVQRRTEVGEDIDETRLVTIVEAKWWRPGGSGELAVCLWMYNWHSLKKKCLKERKKEKRKWREWGKKPQNKRYLQSKTKSVARIDSELLKSRRIKKNNQLNGKVSKSIVRCYRELALSTHQNSYH